MFSEWCAMFLGDARCLSGDAPCFLSDARCLSSNAPCSPMGRTLRRTLRPAGMAMLPLGHDRHLPQWANRFLVPPIRTRDNALRKVNPRFQKEDRQEGAMMRRENALRPKRRRTVTTTHSGTTIWPWKVGMLLSIGTSIFCLGIFWRTNRVPLQK